MYLHELINVRIVENLKKNIRVMYYCYGYLFLGGRREVAQAQHQAAQRPTSHA